jgi:hypothetical protein
MLQLASKTGATLAGKVFLFPQEPVPTVLYHHVCDPHQFHPFFPDWFVFRFGKMRFGFQRFGICCQGTYALYWYVQSC